MSWPRHAAVGTEGAGGERGASRQGRPQGGMRSAAGRAAYWRMNYESAIGALADLIAENSENVEALKEVAGIVADWRKDFERANAERTRENETHANGYALALERYLRPLEAVLARVTPPAQDGTP